MGGTKSRQQNDIKTAKTYWADYKKRKKIERCKAKADNEKKAKPKKPKKGK